MLSLGGLFGRGESKEKLQNRALKYMQRQRWDKALVEFQKLLELAPNDIRLHHKIADLYVRTGKKAEAIAEYKLVANHYVERGDLIKAIAAYKIIVRLDPSFTDAYKQLAELYAQQGIPPEAMVGIHPQTSSEEDQKKRERTPLFSDLSPDEFAEVVSKMIVHNFPQDSIVVKQGDPSTSLFVISSGSVQVIRRESDGKEILLATLKEGEFFGEMSFLTGKPRTATIKTTEETEILELSKQDLEEVIAKYSAVERVLKAFYNSRVKATLKAIQSPS